MIKRAEGESEDGSKSKRKREEEEKLAEIYEGFQFGGLWAKLSESLSRMQDDSNAAMILLPLIEVSPSVNASIPEVVCLYRQSKLT